jgi:hypothetical protein
VNPVVSAAGDGSTVSGEVVFPSGEGVLGSDTVSISTKPQGDVGLGCPQMRPTCRFRAELRVARQLGPPLRCRL